METALKAATFGLSVSHAGQDEEDDSVSWTLDDKQRLIDGVAQYGSDWDQISDKTFGGGYTAQECVLQFLSLPIGESLLTRFQNA